METVEVENAEPSTLVSTVIEQPMENTDPQIRNNVQEHQVEATKVKNAEPSTLVSTVIEHQMETAELENAEPSTMASNVIENQMENTDPQITNHVDKEPKCVISAEEARSIMEVIATTGKFWHDWDMLKIMLSVQLKQVLSEYPESQMASGNMSQRSSLSGQTYLETVRRLDEALLRFIEGPPFTLQRLCEILLTPKSTYRTLSKLALALEKNLLVTSTLSICTDPYPAIQVPKAEEAVIRSEEPQDHSDTAPNGVEPVAGDADEEMADAEAEPEAEPDEDVMNTDIEMREEKVNETSENNAKTSSDRAPPKEP